MLGCRAVPSTIPQIGSPLPSASRSLEDSVPRIPTCKTGLLLLLYSLGEGKGQVGGGAEHRPVLPSTAPRRPGRRGEGRAPAHPERCQPGSRLCLHTATLMLSGAAPGR